MKAAFLFSGQLRGFNHCIDDFKQFLFSSFDSYDTFFYLPPSDGERLFRLITPTSAVFERDQEHRDIQGFQHNICRSDQRSAENNYEARKHMQHYFLQWYGVKRVFDIFESYRSLNNEKYDVVFRIRPDIKFYKKFNYCEFDGIQTSDKSGSGGYYDRLALGSYENMKYYCSLYDCLYRGDYNKFEHTGNSESKLQQHINAGKIMWKTLDLHFYQSVNIDGKYWN
jgi:hypothetical protein